MNRLLIFVIGVVGLGVIAMAVVLVSGGGRETPLVAGLDPTTIGETADNEDAAAVAAGETDTDALARFDAWADPLRAAGFVIGAASVTGTGDALTLGGLDIAAPPEALGWHWTAASVRIDFSGDDEAVITPDGAMMFSLAADADTLSWPVTADSVDFTSERDDAGVVSALTVSFANVAFGDAAAAEPVTAAEARLRMVVAADADASGSLGPSVHFSDLAMPGLAGGPLGTTIQSLDADIVAQGSSGFAAPWRGEGGAFALGNIALHWGALHLTGSGTLAADDMGRPAGTLDVNIANVLLLLDAYNAIERFDRDFMADTYAALLLEMGNDPEADSLPFAIAIEDGEIVLKGEAHGIADIVLGTVSPVFTPVAGD